MPNFTEEQKEAINTDGSNIIVSAGAGSGKTAVLTNRVIRKLKEGININELLILSFTKAAAHEMKERIRDEIKKDLSLKKELNLLDISYITTFDSFALSIVKKYHYLLGVNPDIKLSDSNLILLKKNQILDTIFDELYEEKNQMFLKLVGDFCVKDDKDIREYILDLDSKLDLKIDKEEYLNNYMELFFSDEKITNNISKYMDLITRKREEISHNLEELSFLCDASYFDKLSFALQPILHSHNYGEIKKNLDVKLPNLPRGMDDEVKTRKTYLKDLIDELKILCKYENEEDIKNEILLTYDYVTIIVDILNKLEKRVQKLKKEEELYEFSDIVKMSIHVIKCYDDVKEELKHSFKEIMIDEYQDTNDLQEYFISLIQNNNVYMVGDIKQSIYRFRNANPDIFKNKYLKYTSHDGGIKIDLNKNFRSRSEVLHNINLMFNDLMDLEFGGADYQNSHQMIYGNSVYEESFEKYDMEIYTYEYDKRYTKEEIEFFKVACDIKSKIESKFKVYDKDAKAYRDICYSDFCILMDRSTTFNTCKKIFEYLNIPLSIFKDETITSSYDLIVLQNIISLYVKYLKKEYDNNFKHLFVSLARSFIFEYTDDVIYKKIMDNNFYDDLILEKIKNIKGDSITEILDSIVLEFNLHENYLKLGHVSDCLARLEYVYQNGKSLENMGYTILEMDEYLRGIKKENYEIKLSLAKSDEGVKIMTIHGSKGLEFPICYFLGLDKEFNFKEVNDKFNYSDNYGIITPYSQNGIGQTIYIKLLKRDYIKEEISEKIRLFYVALTRAREKMIFVLPQNKKEYNLNYKLKFKSFAHFIYALKLDNYIIPFTDFKVNPDYNLAKKKTYENLLNKTSEKVSFASVNLDLKEVNSKRFSKSIDNLITKEDIHNMELGKMFHEYLEYIDFKCPNYDLISNLFLKNKIKKFIDNLKDIQKADIYKEAEFMFYEDNTEYHGFIDLILEYDDYIDIIDYKLKYITDDNYKKQLLGYKNYISKIKNKKVNVYLYSILDGVCYNIEGDECAEE